MISSFSFPTSILYGAQARRELKERLVSLRVRQPLIVTDPGVAKTEAFSLLQEALKESEREIYSDIHPNPTEVDVENALKAYQRGKCDGIVALGGGSALDVGKIIRLRIKYPEKTLREFDGNRDWSGLVPFVAIPTTAGTGSEVGRSSVIIMDGKKQVFFHPSLLASLVVLDPELTQGLPSHLTAATGADAFTHCIESFTSPVFHPLCDGIALEGIRLISSALPRAVKVGSDLEARGHMLIAATMGGIAFQKDLGATHSLAHPLSSICQLHHGTANALCLPFVMELNAKRKPGLYKQIGIAMSLSEPSDANTIAAVKQLFTEIGLPPGLKQRGVKESHLDALVEQAFADSCHATNPVPVTKEDLRDLYLEAM